MFQNTTFCHCLELHLLWFDCCCLSVLLRATPRCLIWAVIVLHIQCPANDDITSDCAPTGNYFRLSGKLCCHCSSSASRFDMLWFSRWPCACSTSAVRVEILLLVPFCHLNPHSPSSSDIWPSPLTFPHTEMLSFCLSVCVNPRDGQRQNPSRSANTEMLTPALLAPTTLHVQSH